MAPCEHLAFSFNTNKDGHPPAHLAAAPMLLQTCRAPTATYPPHTYTAPARAHNARSFYCTIFHFFFFLSPPESDLAMSSAIA